MSAGATADCIVLTFGGTSVSSRVNGLNMAWFARARCAPGARVLFVHTALDGITDLETLLLTATRGRCAPLLAKLDAHHRKLAAELQASVSGYRELPAAGLGRGQQRVQSDHVAHNACRAIPCWGPRGPKSCASASLPR